MGKVMNQVLNSELNMKSWLKFKLKHQLTYSRITEIRASREKSVVWKESNVVAFRQIKIGVRT